MRLLPAILLTLLGAALPAQEFDLRGLPADSSVIVAFRNTGELELSKLPAMQALREKMKAANLPNARANKNGELEKKLRDTLGIELEKDLQTVAIGVVIGKPSPLPGVPPDMRAAAVIRGRFDQAKFAAFAEKNKLSTVTVAGHQGWYAAEFMSAVTGESNKPDRESTLFLVDESTVLVTLGKQAENAFACLSGQSPSAALPDYAQALLSPGARNYGLFHVDAAKLPSSPGLEKSGLLNADLLLSEAGTQQVYKLTAAFKDAEKTKQAAGQLQGFLAMAPLFAMPNPKDTPEIQRLKQVAVKVLGGFEPTKVEDTRATAVLKIGNADMVELIDGLFTMALAESQKARPAAPALPQK